MVRPLSMDLRQRVAARIEAGESVRSIAAALMIFGVAACALAVYFPPPAIIIWAILVGAMIGVAASAELDLTAFFTARYFGLRHYGQVYGVTFAAYHAGIGLGPVLVAMLYDLSGSYTVPLIVNALLILSAAGMFVTLGRYPDETGGH